MYPITVSPIFKETVWGGRDLERFFTLPKGKNIGEAWFYACLDKNNSVVTNGAFHGRLFCDVVKKYSRQMLGSRLASKYNKKFPLLFKLMDSNDKLSVQVHPEDRHALLHENSFGKTEMWYILDTKKNSKLWINFRKKTGAAKIHRLLEKDGIVKELREYHVKKAQVYFIPAGTVHSLGVGNIVFEIQQSSDITYRLYDWGRLVYGEPRRMDVEKALKVIKYDPEAGLVKSKFHKFNGSKRARHLVSCSHFNADEVIVDKAVTCRYTLKKAQVIGVFAGSIEIKTSNKKTYRFKQGDLVFLPYDFTNYLIKHAKGTHLIITEVK